MILLIPDPATPQGCPIISYWIAFPQTNPFTKSTTLLLPSTMYHHDRRGRGRDRGHVRGRGGVSSRTTTTPIVTPSPPLGTLIREFRVDDIDETAETLREKAVISDCTPIASYSWLNTREPTILIPGKAAWPFGASI